MKLTSNQGAVIVFTTTGAETGSIKIFTYIPYLDAVHGTVYSQEDAKSIADKDLLLGAALAPRVITWRDWEEWGLVA